MKNRIFTTIILSLLVLSTSLATGTGKKDKSKSADTNAPVSISGTVTDSNTGEALAGVLIKVGDSGTSVYSDFEGNFEIMVTPGDYVLSTALISYEPAELKVKTSEPKNNLTISMETVTKRK
jgi:hypothetical protein